jgi:hypothetical protein
MTNDGVTGLGIAIVMISPLATKTVYREPCVENVQNSTLISPAARATSFAALRSAPWFRTESTSKEAPTMESANCNEVAGEDRAGSIFKYRYLDRATSDQVSRKGDQSIGTFKLLSMECWTFSLRCHSDDGLGFGARRPWLVLDAPSGPSSFKSTGDSTKELVQKPSPIAAPNRSVLGGGNRPTAKRRFRARSCSPQEASTYGLTIPG